MAATGRQPVPVFAGRPLLTPFPCCLEVWCLSFGVHGVDRGLAGVVRAGVVVGAQVLVGQVDIAAAGTGDAVPARVVAEPGDAVTRPRP